MVVGGGHNGLVAAAYIAGAGRSCLVLERGDEFGGAAVSAHAFAGFDACVSRYSYLVSLLPSLILGELGLSLRLARRRASRADLRFWKRGVGPPHRKVQKPL